MREFIDDSWDEKIKIAQHRRSVKSRESRKQAPHVMKNGIEHKSCSGCASLKPLDEFYVNHYTPDGLCSSCKECDKERSRIHYLEKKNK